MDQAKKAAKVKQQENDDHEFKMSMRLATDVLTYIKKLYAERTENKADLAKHLKELVDK